MHEMEEARLPAPGPVLRRIKDAIEARGVRRIAASITVSPSIAGHYQRKHGIDRPAVVLNAPRIERGARTGETVRDRIGLPPHVPLAVYTGVLAEGRGNEHMLDAIAMLDAVHLAVIGPVRPAMEPRLAAARAAAGGRIHAVAPVAHDEVVPFIATADIGLCTIAPTCLNHEYCLPNKLFEMTFAGLALLVTDNVELKRFVEAAGNGVAVPSGDAVPIAGGIRHVLALRERYAPDKARLAALIAAYDWSAQEQVLLGVYGRVLADRRKRDAA
jgi:glycosyltransferase involved in cell wall biosynthesis